MNRRIVVGVTGASGAWYAARLVDVLLASGRDVYLSVSEAAREVIGHEMGVPVDLDRFDPTGWLAALERHNQTRGGPATGRVVYSRVDDLTAPIASGSFLTEGMVVCPCSSATLSAIVHGTGRNLIHRAAEVHLKEGRKLVLVPRETPLSLVQLENMGRAVRAGAVILPAMPGFYHRPESVGQLVDFVVARICDQLGIRNQLIRRWGEEA